MIHGPLTEVLPFIKGMLCGSLVIGSFTVPNGLLVQVALLIIAALVFLNEMFMFGRELHLLSFLLSLVAGLVLGAVFAVAGLIGPWVVVVFVVTATVYLYELMNRKDTGKRIPASEHPGD